MRLRDPEGDELARRARPVVFTHRGISGPGAMDLSEPVAREEAEAASSRRARRAHALVLDLVPALEREELRARCLEAAALPGAPLLAASLAAELALPRRLIEAVLAQARVPVETRVNALARPARHALVESLKGLEVPVDGTLGFDAAEVTAGGLALPALDPRTLRVNGMPDLWAFGELIDVQARSWLNFQAAFATAELAARSVGR